MALLENVTTTYFHLYVYMFLCVVRQTPLCECESVRPGSGSDPAGSLSAGAVLLPGAYRQAAQLYAKGTGGLSHQEDPEHQ